eukprot:5686413-Prymnesium_polylepis.1
MKDAKRTASALYRVAGGGGYTMEELKAAYDAKELKRDEFTPSELKKGGFEAVALKRAGFTARQMAEEDDSYTIAELRNEG